MVRPLPGLPLAASNFTVKENLLTPSQAYTTAPPECIAKPFSPSQIHARTERIGPALLSDTSIMISGYRPSVSSNFRLTSGLGIQRYLLSRAQCGVNLFSRIKFCTPDDGRRQLENRPPSLPRPPEVFLLSPTIPTAPEVSRL